MKKALIVLLLWPSILFSQCSIDDIIVFEHGINKFDAIKKTKSIKGFRESKRNAESVAKWHKLDYIADSVYKDSHYFDFSNLKCYKWSSCTYSVHFADDNLYQQILQVEVDTIDYKDYLEIYSKIVQLFRLEFAFTNSIEKKHPETSVKEGEGFVFTDSDTPLMKTDEVRVYKTISYKYDLEKRAPTSEIDKYIITIESTDLKGTKMDNRGY